MIAALDPRTWRLRVGGLARRPLSLSLEELRSMPCRTVPVTLECAGNGRSALHPPVPGEQWGLGAAGIAAWTGVPLTEVLDLAAPRLGAREVVFRGADRGPVEGRDGPVHFERSLPLGQLGSAGALLANVQIVQADARRTGLPAATADLVHARLVLVNISRPAEVVAPVRGRKAIMVRRPPLWLPGAARRHSQQAGRERGR